MPRTLTSATALMCSLALAMPTNPVLAQDTTEETTGGEMPEGAAPADGDAAQEAAPDETPAIVTVETSQAECESSTGESEGEVFRACMIEMLTAGGNIEAAEEFTRIDQELRAEAEAARAAEEAAAEEAAAQEAAEAEAAEQEAAEAAAREAEAAAAEQEAAEAAAREAEAAAEAAAQAEAAAAQAEAEAQAQADAEAAAQAEAEVQAEAEAQAQADAEAQAAADAAAQAEADAQAAAEAEASAAPAPEEAAPEEAVSPVAEETAPTETAPEAETAESDAPAATEETEQAEDADAPAQSEQPAEEAATETPPEAETTTETASDAPAAETEDVASEAPSEEPAPDAAPAQPESEIAAEVAAQPEPELTEEEETARDRASEALDALDGLTEGAVIGAVSGEAAEAEVQEETVQADDVRRSSEDFDTSAVVTERERDDDDDDGGLTRGQKIALGAIGALAVGTILNRNSRVVSNSGDRVIVQQDDGALRVLKDDDALLRQEGANVRTESFNDGSTRTTVTREDGSRVITIRDAALRVLRRTLIQPNGAEYVLIDDTQEVAPVEVSTLPNVAPTISTRTGDDALGAAIDRELGLDRRFTLAQVRNIQQVRALAPAFDVSTVTFASGSAAIAPEQAGNLTDLAREVLAAIRANPREVFLIEGHTDAVGDAAYNLALSDRRAESLALALNEYFGVPVENMVVQGYGEEFLRVQTQAAERANRRATVRQITKLLQTAAAN